MNFKKANIVIITLFITILVGIMGLITTKYVINLLQTSSENKKYYKAYYVGYAGLELELLKDKNHSYGFEDTISSGSKTVSKNFTGINYYFSSKILSMSNYITNTEKSLYDNTIDCSNPNNRINLATGDSVMIPLFYDENTGEGIISGLNYKITDFSNTTLSYDGNVVISYNKKIDPSSSNSDIGGAGKKYRLTGNGTDSIYSNLGTPTLSVNDQPFLVVGAITPSKICLENSPQKLVSSYTYIVSEGNYMDRKVTVKVVKYNKWASFAVYGMY